MRHGIHLFIALSLTMAGCLSGTPGASECGPSCLEGARNPTLDAGADGVRKVEVWMRSEASQAAEVTVPFADNATGRHMVSVFVHVPANAPLTKRAELYAKDALKLSAAVTFADERDAAGPAAERVVVLPATLPPAQAYRLVIVIGADGEVRWGDGEGCAPRESPCAVAV